MVFKGDETPTLTTFSPVIGWRRAFRGGVGVLGVCGNDLKYAFLRRGKIVMPPIGLELPK